MARHALMRSHLASRGVWEGGKEQPGKERLEVRSWQREQRGQVQTAEQHKGCRKDEPPIRSGVTQQGGS